MKRLVTLFSVLIVAIWYISSLALPTTAVAQTAQKDRLVLMKTIGGNMKKLKMAGDTETMATSAKIIIETAKKLSAKGLWPKGSHGGETRAKEEIWQDMGDFMAKLKATKNAAVNLLKVSMGGNLGDAKNAFGAMGRTCGGCHKLYRIPKF